MVEERPHEVSPRAIGGHGRRPRPPPPRDRGLAGGPLLGGRRPGDDRRESSVDKGRVVCRRLQPGGDLACGIVHHRRVGQRQRLLRHDALIALVALPRRGVIERREEWVAADR